MRFAGLALVLALAACKSSGPTTPRPATGAPFGGLFTADTSWRFTVKAESSRLDDEGVGAINDVSTSETSCRVIAVRAFPGGRASEIECDERADSRVAERIAGVWIQTADGLWHDTTLPDEGRAPTLDAAARFLPANPKPVHDEQTEPEGPDGPSGGGGSIHDVAPSGDGWCVSHSSWGGDESWHKLCLDSVGPSAGGAGWAGGSTSEVTFERL